MTQYAFLCLHPFDFQTPLIHSLQYKLIISMNNPYPFCEYNRNHYLHQMKIHLAESEKGFVELIGQLCDSQRRTGNP